MERSNILIHKTMLTTRAYGHFQQTPTVVEKYKNVISHILTIRCSLTSFNDQKEYFVDFKNIWKQLTSSLHLHLIFLILMMLCCFF